MVPLDVEVKKREVNKAFENAIHPLKNPCMSYLILNTRNL
jgi:hypothetical protein